MRYLGVLVRLLAVAALAALAGCGSSGSTSKPGPVGEFKVGKPYQINGVWYYPKVDWEYRETGIASWYGPGFHGKKTANGETYDQMALTAAHPTLPMPVMVQVTNLENGRSLKVRINDRGPFANGRIIDLSKRSAQLLGIEQKGTAKVLVEILPNESQQLVAVAQSKTPVTDDSDVPEAAPVGAVESKPLGGATVTAGPQPTTSSQPQQPVPVSQPQVAGVPLPQPDGRVEQKNVLPTQIYIQAGSFANPANAEALKNKLARYGSAFVAAVKIGRDTFYRVRIGPLASVEEADRTLSNLIAAGHPESRVVVE